MLRVADLVPPRRSYLAGASSERCSEPLPQSGTAQACPGAQKCAAWVSLGTLTCVCCWLDLAVLARRAVQEYIITSIKEVLRNHFNRAVELKVGPCGVESAAGAQYSWSWSLLCPSCPWWTPFHPLDRHASVTSSGKPFLTPDWASVSPSEDELAEWEQRGSKTRAWGDDPND